MSFPHVREENGIPADEIIGLYQRHAEEWDRGRGRDLFEKPWLDRLLDLLPPNGSILDIGCGGGEPIAQYFIEAGHGVTGIDSSPALIDICRERYPDHAWVVSDMRSLALDRRFDGLLAWDSSSTCPRTTSVGCSRSSVAMPPRGQP